MSEHPSPSNRVDRALEQEARFFRVSLELFVVVDLQGCIRRINPCVEKKLGYEPEEVVGRSIFEFILPDDHQRVRAAIEVAASGREISGLQCCCVHRDGSLRWLTCSCPPVAPGEDELLVVCRDITDTRYADERFRQLVDASPTGIIVVASDGRITFANPQAQQTFGYSAEQLLGEEIELLIPPRFHQKHRQARSEYAESPVPRSIDIGRSFWGRRKDGQEFPVEIALTPITMQNQPMVICTIVDLTERVAAQKALAESDRRLGQILDNATAVMYLKNMAGRYLVVNRQFEELFKVTRTQVVGKTDDDIFPHEIAEVFRANDQQVLTTGEVTRIEEIAPHDDGPHTYVSVKFPLRDSDSRVYAVAGISTDITDRIQRIRTEHELQAARCVQQNLYPKSAPELRGFDVAGAVFPASETCGDYFDFIPLSQDILALVVGDVAGHGLGPALLMVQTRAYLRALLTDGTPPAEAIGKLNALLLEDTPQESFVTLFLAVVDARQRQFIYVAAGHEARLIRAGGATENLVSTGLVLGVVPDAPLRRVGPKQLVSGDILLVATDGVQEALSPQKEMFGWNRTLDVVRRNGNRPAREIIDSLYAAVCEFCPEHRQHDDMTVLIAKAL